MKRRGGRRRPFGWMFGVVFLGGLALPWQWSSLEEAGSEINGDGVAGQVAAIEPPVAACSATPCATSADTPPSVPAVDAAELASETAEDPHYPMEDRVVGPAALEPMQTVEALPGDTPFRLLMRAGVTPDDAQAAIRTLSSVWDPRGLRAGQKAAVFVQSDRLLSVRLPLAPGRDVVVARDDTGNFVAEDQERPTAWVASLGTGTIWTSLSEAASRASVPMSVVSEMIRAFSYDVDFQREIHPGDTFSALYERVHDEAGKATGVGRLLYGEMVLSGTRLRLYRYTTPDGETGFFNAVGENIRKPLLRTPIDGARLTSSFGMRFHPILGYSRMHRGVDFGAVIGTPVYAAGDGVVSRAGRVSGYGNYIEIEHNQEYATAYGHLSGFARGLHEGARVRQGDVIGFVGMTGMATGPHLHYEVHDHGTQIDPLSVRMPALTRLAGNELKAFQNTRSAIDRALLEMRHDLVATAAEKGQAAAAP
jgi:murein DD-endopeptidase MepM/ murein hydrolase activator NlpD